MKPLQRTPYHSSTAPAHGASPRKKRLTTLPSIASFPASVVTVACHAIKAPIGCIRSIRRFRVAGTACRVFATIGTDRQGRRGAPGPGGSYRGVGPAGLVDGLVGDPRRFSGLKGMPTRLRSFIPMALSAAYCRMFSDTNMLKVMPMIAAPTTTRPARYGRRECGCRPEGACRVAREYRRRRT